MTGMLKHETFIGEYFIDESLCQQIIKYFENRTDLQEEGKIGDQEIDSSRKSSTDMCLDKCEEYFHLYFGAIYPFFRDYCEKYRIKPNDFPMRFLEPTNIQRYLPNQGFFIEHHERSNLDLDRISRELVFMTYLNTIEDFSENQGATVFPFQNQFVRPEIGKTLIWPAGFTHRHYGITHKSETKYIVTGWKHLMVEQ